jgi:hypothetical protein
MGLIGLDLEKIFNIKPQEFRFVKLLFLHNFFQGIALSLFFTAANAIFLANYDVSYLPYVYILSGFVLMFTGAGYSWLQNKLSVKRLLQSVLVILFVSVFLMRMGLAFTQHVWIAFFIMIWYRVISLLSNLEFWGLSSMMMDVRQSKRLFGIVSAGEVTAKLLGYLSVPALIALTGINNLVIIAAFSFLITLYFLNKLIVRMPVSSFNPKDIRTENGSKENMIVRYFKSDFIILLSILSFIAVMAFTFIDFSFLYQVKLKYTTDEQLAYFFGLFYGFNKGVVFFVKMFLSGRLIERLGIKNALLFIPSIFIMIILGIIFYNFLVGEASIIFYMFILLMFISETLRYSLHEPVFFSLFQPLEKKIRLFGHIIVNGFLNPIALTIGGLILLIIIRISGIIQLSKVSYILFFLLLLWVLIVILTNRQYIIVLKDAVKKRFFEGSEIPVKGKVIHDILFHRLESDYPEEVIYSAELLYKMDKQADLIPITKKLLKHPNTEVKIYALKKIEEKKLRELSGVVLDIINNIGPLKLKEPAIRAFCMVDDAPVEKILNYLETSDIHIRKGAITGLLKSGGLEAVVLSGQQLLNLIQSDDVDDKIIATEIIGDLGIKNFYKPILDFFDHKNEELKKNAIIAAGKIRNPRFIPLLIDLLTDKNYHQYASIALTTYGTEAVEHISTEIKHEKQIEEIRLIRYCQICGKIGGKKAHEVLLGLMDYPRQKIQNEVLFSLRQAGYIGSGGNNTIRDKLEKEFENTYWLYTSIVHLKETKIDNDWLIHALELELDQSKENIFNILSFLYDSHTIFKAKEGLSAEAGEKKANALEIIDNLISKRLSVKLSLIFEEGEIRDKVKKLAHYYKTEINHTEDILSRILSEKDKRFNTWTQVAAMTAILSSKSSTLITLLLPYLKSDKKILKETAKDTINKVVELESGEPESNQLLLFKQNQIGNIMHSVEETRTLLDIEKVIILKSTDLFSETPETILVDIAGIVKEERIEAGTTLFHKGDKGSSMYIINEGEIKIHDGDYTFAVLKNRDFFGEFALLDVEPRSASASALKDTLLLRLDQADFYDLMSERMEVAKGIMIVLTRRLRRQNETITKLKSQVSVSTSPSSSDE